MNTLLQAFILFALYTLVVLPFTGSFITVEFGFITFMSYFLFNLGLALVFIMLILALINDQLDLYEYLKNTIKTTNKKKD